MGSWGSYTAVTVAGYQGTSSSFVLHDNDRETIFRLEVKFGGNLPGCNMLLWAQDYQ